MRLKEVKIKNFRGYGENPNDPERWYVFQHLDRDFVLFQGYNGYGKTSFFEAIEWCITDQVGRLTEMYQRTYNASELKQSYYLKFYHHKKQKNRHRQVEVSLLFNDGLEVTRTSRSKSLKTTPKDKTYRSVLTVKKHGKLLEDIESTQQLLNYVLVTEAQPDCKQFVNTHMLAQDRIHEFLSEKNPKERYKIFMQLLNLDRINKLFNRLDGLKNNRSAISSKRSKINLEFSILETNQQGIQRFLDGKNFGNMDQYIEGVSSLTKQLQTLAKQAEQHKISLSKMKLSAIVSSAEITPKTCVEHLHNVEKARTSVVKEEQRLRENKIQQSKLRETLQRLLLWDQLEKLVVRADQASKVQVEKYHELLEERIIIEQQLDTLKKSKKENKVHTDELSTYKSLFSNYNMYLNKSQCTIQDSFWELLNKDRETWGVFQKQFEVLLNKVSQPLSLSSLESTDWTVIKTKYDELFTARQKINKEIGELKEKRNSLSEMNEQYQETLDVIRDLLGQQEFGSCPVCWNEDFTHEKYQGIFVDLEEGSTLNRKIEALIDASMSNGDSRLQKIVEEIAVKENEEKTWKKRIEKECIEQIFKLFQAIQNEYVGHYDRVSKELQRENHSLMKLTVEWREKEKQNLSQRRRVEDNYRELFQNDITMDLINLDDITERLKAIIDERDAWFAANRVQMSLTDMPSVGEVSDTVRSLRQTRNIDKYYPNKSKRIDEELDVIENQIKQLEQLSTLLTELVGYKVPDEYESKFEEYSNLSDKMEDLQKMLQMVDIYDSKVDDWHARISTMQRNIVEKKLKIHPIISWVYETINPHPFYKKLIIENGDRGALFTSESAEVYLDQIFSAAQLNILALSVFLGLGLSSGNTILDQLFLDDPIQSMDDVNVLAFIDVLRAVMDSSYSNKKIVLSTHNDNFARLLAIKMRNRQITHYKFNGYGVEGPLFERVGY